MTNPKTSSATNTSKAAKSDLRKGAVSKSGAMQSKSSGGGTGDAPTQFTPTPAAAVPLADVAPAVPRQTKSSMVRARLAEPGGVSLAVLMEATGWQAHTLRAALTGLRKTGLVITRHREGADTVYAIDDSGSGPATGTNDEAPVSSDAGPKATVGPDVAGLVTTRSEDAAAGLKDAELEGAEPETATSASAGVHP